MHEDFRAKLTTGFANVRNRGYFARQNWSCCQTCGLAKLPNGISDYVFYHKQDAARMHDDESRILAMVPKAGVYLCWGGDGEEIRKAFLEAGLAVTWNGSESQRIYVSLPPEPH